VKAFFPKAACASAFLIALLSAPPSTVASDSAIDAQTANQIHGLLTSIVETGKAEGAVLLIGRNNDELLRDKAGTLTAESAIPVAAALHSPLPA